MVPFIFVDDSTLFFDATHTNSIVLKECLILYEKQFDQHINMDKVVIFFNSNTIEQMQDGVCYILGIPNTMSHGSFLGLPCLIERKKK